MTVGNDRPARGQAPALARVVSKRQLVRLRKQHSSLVAKVRHKRSAITRMRDEARTVRHDIAQRSADLHREQRNCDTLLHAAFRSIETKPALGRFERRTARQLYRTLQDAGVLTQSVAPPAAATDPASDPAASAAPTQPMRAAAIRPMFLRLATEYHPDKTTDDEVRVRHTEVMKQLNHAYRDGDVSRLLELEKALGQGTRGQTPPDAATLETQVTALRSQLRDLSREMSGLRRDYDGAIVIEFRRLTQAGCSDPTEAIINNFRRSVAHTRLLLAHVERFLDCDMDTDELLAGPDLGADADDAWLAHVFATVHC